MGRQVAASQRDDDGIVAAEQNVDLDDLPDSQPIQLEKKYHAAPERCLWPYAKRHGEPKLPASCLCACRHRQSSEPIFRDQSTDFSKRPISEGLRVTLMPQADMISSLASAETTPPKNKTPTKTKHKPGGAVTPAMNPTTGFFMLSLI